MNIPRAEACSAHRPRLPSALLPAARSVPRRDRTLAVVDKRPFRSHPRLFATCESSSLNATRPPLARSVVSRFAGNRPGSGRMRRIQGGASRPKYITIGYGDQAGYERTAPSRREAAHRHDAQLQADGALMGSASHPVQVRNHDGAGVHTTEGPFMRADLPIAGFAVIEATNIEQAIQLASQAMRGGSRSRRGLAARRQGRLRFRHSGAADRSPA